MQSKASQQALKEWRTRIGTEQVLNGDAIPSVYRDSCDGSCRRVLAVLRPAGTREVVACVQVAAQYGLPLYPVSRGRNWGMGSYLPARDDGVILDLQRMDRILEINEEEQYAVVEPGVTQGQLYEEIQRRNLALVMNVTGSGRGSSLVGNALERGGGYFASRADELFGLEVVLSDGRVLQTGCSHYAGARSVAANPHGVGPDLNGLFQQGAMGVVTRAGVKLLPRLPSHFAALFSVGCDQDLGLLVETVARLRKSGVLRTAVHMADRARTRISICPWYAEQLHADTGLAGAALRQAAQAWFERQPFGAWSAVAGIWTTPGQARSIKREIRKACRGGVRVRFLSDRLFDTVGQVLRCLPGTRPLQRLLATGRPFFDYTQGIPSDAALGSVAWPVADLWQPGAVDPDATGAGLLYVLPMIPLSAADAQSCVAQTRKTFSAAGFEAYITLNTVSDRALEGVINLAFDRRDEQQTQRARDAVRTLTAEFMGMGYIPYRSGLATMDQLVDEGDIFWQVTRDLRRALDPHGVIAPGRY